MSVQSDFPVRTELICEQIRVITVGKRGRKKPKQVAEQTVQTPKIANDLEIVGNSEEEEEEPSRSDGSAN